ncbi:transcription factor atoh8 [Polymixia lowei]
MRNPHLLTNDWHKPFNGNKTDPSLVSVPSMNKKFKRKSREPKRLYNSTSDPVGLKTFRPDFTPEEDSAEDTQEELCTIGPVVPVQRQLMMSHKSILNTTGILPGVPEGKLARTSPPNGQSGAIDMRIGSNVPAITAKLSQLPVSQLPNLQSPHWPSSIPQPQPNGHKLGPFSTFPPVTAPNTSHNHPSLHHSNPQPQDASLSGRLVGNQARVERAVPLSLSGASQIQRNGHAADPQDDSPKESPRKRVGVGADPSSGRVPEIKALQQTRRLLANARERTRVHTISAAFEALRKQVPCYSYGQKLSKLAILRIACNYILSLAQLAELDYSPDHSSLTFSQCVEQCTRTLQAEGRSKKRKE